MNIPREPNARTLAGYLSGECSPSEAAEVERWSWSSPDHTKQLEALRAVWSEDVSDAIAGVGKWSSDELWRTIEPRLDEERLPSLRLVTPGSPRRTPVVGMNGRRKIVAWATVAACVVRLIGVSIAQRTAVDQA